jgi:hypothetical protein
MQDIGGGDVLDAVQLVEAAEDLADAWHEALVEPEYGIAFFEALASVFERLPADVKRDLRLRPSGTVVGFLRRCAEALRDEQLVDRCDAAKALGPERPVASC